MIIVMMLKLIVLMMMIIFKYRRWQWSWPWRLPHVPNIFALRHVLTDASSSQPHVLDTSHKSMSFTVLGVEDGDGDYYDGDGSKQAASDFNFGHFLWAWVSQRLACGPRPWRDGGAPATLFPNWHQVASIYLFAFPDLLCCWTEVDIVNVGVEPGHDIIINYYHLRQELFTLYTRTIISVTILAPNNPGPLTQCM